MAMPLGTFIYDIAEPNVAEFSAAPGSMHRGFNAVSAVDALAAHIFYELKRQGKDPFEAVGGRSGNRNDDSAFRGELARRDPAFELLRDLAKANKHAFLVHHDPKINGSDNTRVKALGYGEGGLGAGAWGDNRQLTVTDLNGNEHNLLSIVNQSLSLLRNLANKQGLL